MAQDDRNGDSGHSAAREEPRTAHRANQSDPVRAALVGAVAVADDAVKCAQVALELAVSTAARTRAALAAYVRRLERDQELAPVAPAEPATSPARGTLEID